MDIKQMLGLLGNFFPNLNGKIEEAKKTISGVENSFEGVKNFLKASNITNEQIEKVANMIQTHPAAKMIGQPAFLVANQIRQLKGGDMNADKSIAPTMKMPTQTQRRTTKL